MAGDRVLLVDVDEAEVGVWCYGLAHSTTGLMVLAGRLRFDPATGTLEPIGGPPPDLFVTAALLVRQRRRPPIVYDLTIRPLPADLRGPLRSGPSPSPAAGGHRKATDGKAKGGGRTLGERAAAGGGSHSSTVRRPDAPGSE